MIPTVIDWARTNIRLLEHLLCLQTVERKREGVTIFQLEIGICSAMRHYWSTVCEPEASPNNLFKSTNSGAMTAL